MILLLSLPFKFMRRHVNAGHMSNPFTYLTSPIISEDRLLAIGRKLTPEQKAILKRFRLGPYAGALAPAIVLPDASTNEPVSFLERFSRTFTVLYFCNNSDEGLKALQRVQAELPAFPVALYLVTPRLPGQPLPPGTHVLLDSEKKGAGAYNAGSNTLYVVRPDRHIAARRFKSDLSELPILLRRAIGEWLDSAPVKEHIERVECISIQLFQLRSVVKTVVVFAF